MRGDERCDGQGRSGRKFCPKVSSGTPTQIGQSLREVQAVRDWQEPATSGGGCRGPAGRWER